MAAALNCFTVQQVMSTTHFECHLGIIMTELNSSQRRTCEPITVVHKSAPGFIIHQHNDQTAHAQNVSTFFSNGSIRQEHIFVQKLVQTYCSPYTQVMTLTNYHTAVFQHHSLLPYGLTLHLKLG